MPERYSGPFASEDEFNAFLIAPAYAPPEKLPILMKRVQKLFDNKHKILYTHGDLKHHNILVHNGHISGCIDWESAGWYPEYWDLTTALRFAREDFWWYHFVLDLGGQKYLKYMDAERALLTLTTDSFPW